MTPAQLELRGKRAANARWSQTPRSERRAHGLRGQAGLLAKFEAQVPESVTDPAERAQLAAQALRSHMQGLTLKSIRARSRKASGADVG